MWEALGEWVQLAQPQLGPGTKERFDMASQLTTEEVRCCPHLMTDYLVL